MVSGESGQYDIGGREGEGGRGREREGGRGREEEDDDDNDDDDASLWLLAAKSTYPNRRAS